MSMRYSLRPIQDWPGTPRWQITRRTSRFRTDRDNVLRFLAKELAAIGAERFVLEVEAADYDITADGALRKGARCGPSVIVNADTLRGPIRMPCATYETQTANIHAIALTLEALRAIDRYGVALRGEQYSGWSRIAATSHFTRQVDAWQLLEEEAAQVLRPRTRVHLNMLYLLASKRAHPDVGGSHERMSAINAARDTLISGGLM